MMQLWMRQIAAVLRLEMKKTFFSKRGWWIYCLAAGPVAITVMHWLFEMRSKRLRPPPGRRQHHLRRLFQFFYLRGGDFLRLHGHLLQPVPREMLEKTLHYYYLTPMRRELLVIGKYLAGLSVAVVLFVGSTAAWPSSPSRAISAPAWTDYLYHGPGMSQLGSYMLVAALAASDMARSS
jgi:uncharacterized membrane protein